MQREAGRGAIPGRRGARSDNWPVLLYVTRLQSDFIIGSPLHTTSPIHPFSLPLPLRRAGCSEQQTTRTLLCPPPSIPLPRHPLPFSAPMHPAHPRCTPAHPSDTSTPHPPSLASSHSTTLQLTVGRIFCRKSGIANSSHVCDVYFCSVGC